jgi:hypothetical protein
MLATRALSAPWRGVGRTDDRCLVILRGQRCYKKGDFERSVAHRDQITLPGARRARTTPGGGMILVAAMKLRHADMLVQ